MRRHLKPRCCYLDAGTSQPKWTLTGDALRPCQSRSDNVFIARGPFTNDLSVVGSDGIFYRVRHETLYPTEPVGPSVVPPPPSSILEAIDLDPNSKRPVDSLPLRDWLRNSVSEKTIDYISW